MVLEGFCWRTEGVVVMVGVGAERVTTLEERKAEAIEVCCGVRTSSDGWFRQSVVDARWAVAVTVHWMLVRRGSRCWPAGRRQQ